MANRNWMDAWPISGSGKETFEEEEEDVSRGSESVGGSVNGITFSTEGL